jgi:hypothetical protein
MIRAANNIMDGASVNSIQLPLFRNIGIEQSLLEFVIVSTMEYKQLAANDMEKREYMSKLTANDMGRNLTTKRVHVP